MATDNMATEGATVTELKGMPGNPGRDPKSRAKSGIGTMGDRALMDAVIIVALAWALLVVLHLSLRAHNV